MLSTDRMVLQNAEFDALERLMATTNGLFQTAVVDDDYPEMRHRYEGALHDFLQACKANGRNF